MIYYAVENSCGTMINATKECLAEILNYENSCKKWKAPYPEDFGQISIAVSLVKILKFEFLRSSLFGYTQKRLSLISK